MGCIHPNPFILNNQEDDHDVASQLKPSTKASYTRSKPRWCDQPGWHIPEDKKDRDYDEESLFDLDPGNFTVTRVEIHREFEPDFIPRTKFSPRPPSFSPTTIVCDAESEEKMRADIAFRYAAQSGNPELDPYRSSEFASSPYSYKKEVGSDVIHELETTDNIFFRKVSKLNSKIDHACESPAGDANADQVETTSVFAVVDTLNRRLGVETSKREPSVAQSTQKTIDAPNHDDAFNSILTTAGSNEEISQTPSSKAAIYDQMPPTSQTINYVSSRASDNDRRFSGHDTIDHEEPSEVNKDRPADDFQNEVEDEYPVDVDVDDGNLVSVDS